MPEFNRPPIDPRNKMLWHLGHLQQLRTTGKTQAPVNVEIDLSNRCSLGCSWCHFAYTHTRGPLAGKMEKPVDAVPGGDLMDLTLAENILWQLSEAGVQSVTWTGGGEPTLHPQFEQIVRHAHSRGLAQGLYTHGGHVDPKRASLLKRLLTWVYVSLDECTAEDYRRSKGVRGFERALEGIRNLVATPGKATIGVGFLLHRHNHTHVRAMVQLARDLGVDYVQFRPTVVYNQDNPGVPAEDTRWLRQVQDRLRVHAGDPFVLADVERFDMYRTWQGHGYNTCHWSAMQTVITPNGKVWRCVNKREHAGALLGDLTKEPFAYIWAKAGQPCAVDGACRVMCRGHIGNLMLDAVLTEPAHKEFV